MFNLFRKSNIKTLNSQEVKELIKNEKNLTIIDIRTSLETANGKIPGSRNIDFYGAKFQSEIAKLDKEKNYLVYCASGGRSKAACGLMDKMGFKNIYELKGGFFAY